MKKAFINNLSAETLAAFLDGNATLQEHTDIIKALPADAELRELLHISQSVDADLGMKPQDCEWIPMTAMAATCNEENYCCLECEKYVLGEMGIDFNEELLLQNAIQNGWQKEQGTARHNIGRHLESMGLVVSRRFKCSVEDISNALAAGQQAIVAVDGGELSGNYKEEQLEDLLIDEIPDHSVVVLSCDLQQNVITVFDPNSMNAQDIYPLEQFFLRVRVNAEGVVVVGHQVVEALAEIFETEDKSNPYSDLQIVELLKERGLDIKHRTVTKYRNQMGVPIAKNRQVL
jgi:hypothetical protein